MVEATSSVKEPAAGTTTELRGKLLAIYERLKAHYGPLHWWPADSPFEVIVGAVLTQNTAWTNVEKAIANLKAAGVLHPKALLELSLEVLADYIRPSGYFTVKARRLRTLLEWLGEDGESRLSGGLEEVRRELLRVKGVGAETADSILLYAAGRPTFVIDAYTRRILDRIAIEPPERSYEGYRQLFMDALPQDTVLYNEFHAQLVSLGKDYCRKTPRCAGCPLLPLCPTGQKSPPKAQVRP